jgi:hypothetical protein
MTHIVSSQPWVEMSRDRRKYFGVFGAISDNLFLLSMSELRTCCLAVFVIILLRTWNVVCSYFALNLGCCHNSFVVGFDLKLSCLYNDSPVAFNVTCTFEN